MIPKPIRFVLLTTALSCSSAPAAADPGALLKLIAAPAVSPQDLAWDPESRTYFVTTVIDGRIIQLSEDLTERVDEIPSPFDAGEFLTGIAYDSRDQTLWVVQPQIPEIAEIKKDGTPTGRRIAPPFQPVVNPGSDPNPRGLAYDPNGDSGNGSLYVVESVGTLIYEVDFAGGIIRSFTHLDDPDGYPGKGANAGCSDIDPIYDAKGNLSGFWANGFDRERRTSFLRKLDAEGKYSGISILLESAGGTVSGFLVKDYRSRDGTENFNPAVIGVVESKAEFAILDGFEPPLGEIYGLTCAEGQNQVVLSWNDSDAYDTILIFRDCLQVAQLAGTASQYVDAQVPAGIFEYQVRARKGDLESETKKCKAVLGPGQVLRIGDFEGEVAVDVAVDDLGQILVSDYYARSLRVFVIDRDRIEPIAEWVTPLEAEEDRLTGVAFRPETRTLFLYNSETNGVVEMENRDRGQLLGSFPVVLPNDPNDPKDQATVLGMDYSPEGNGGKGSLWFLENTRSLIYEVDLLGNILRSFPHPDLLRVPPPPNSDLAPFTSGLAVVPGSGGKLLALSGGTILDRGSTRIFILDTAAREALAGQIIPLDGADKAAPHSYPCFAYGEDGGNRVLYLSTIVHRDSHVLEIDASDYPLRPLTDLECHQDGFSDALVLTFSNNDAYDHIEVFRNCAPHRDLPGSAVEFRDAPAAPGVYRYEVRAWRGGLFTTFLSCTVRAGAGAKLRRQFIETPSPVQLAPDPVDGTFLISSNTFQNLRHLVRLDSQFQVIETLENMVDPPYQVASMAIRKDPQNGGREIYVFGWEVPNSLNVDNQNFLMRVFDLSGQPPPKREFPLHPPKPKNGFVTYPVGLTWHPPSDTFYYLERNSSTFVQLSPTGQVLREFPHPLPPRQSFVFNLGLWADPESGALFAATAGPKDHIITLVVQLTPSGLLTGIDLPVGGLPINPITGIAMRPSLLGGDELVLAGAEGGVSEVVLAEAFDALPAPRNLQCQIAGGKVELSWQNGGAYETISILRRGVEVAALPGAAESFTDPDLGWIGVRVYSVRGLKGGGFGRNAFCEVSQSQQNGHFIRGNVDGSAEVDLTDAIVLLTYMFLGGQGLSCEDAADVDDNGQLEITDAIRILTVLFLGDTPPPPPYPNPGEDPTPDGLTCGT
ncbi:MAG: hypothetical protein HY717_22840 [Planctomycetes bacterium]|nr:hypothetical protein [Planctomycetota bacterium]